jgi:hypothetical protein
MSRSSWWRSIRPLQLSHPRALCVPRTPGGHGVGEDVQLHAALALPRPHVRQRPAELGMPQQRGEIVQRDDHADVVDRAVGERADRAIRQRASAEQPDVARRRGGDGVVEVERGAGHRP